MLCSLAKYVRNLKHEQRSLTVSLYMQHPFLDNDEPNESTPRSLNDAILRTSAEIDPLRSADETAADLVLQVRRSRCCFAVADIVIVSRTESCDAVGPRCAEEASLFQLCVSASSEGICSELTHLHSNWEDVKTQQIPGLVFSFCSMHLYLTFAHSPFHARGCRSSSRQQ